MKKTSAKIFTSTIISLVGFSALFACFFYARADGEDITISANTTWTAGTYNYQDITITNNAVLTLSGSSTTDTDGVGVIINARTITVDSGAKISADAKGYPAGFGTGKGNGQYGSGAGYGGVGAVGGTGNAGGIVYGSVVQPVDLGSGGGGGGGAGGGAIQLNLSGNLIANGTISANAGAGGYWKGGGSGGSIYVKVTDISGTGTITSIGGNGGNSSGSGAGGRIAIYHNGVNSFDRTKILASGGTGGTANGGAGSVLVFDRGNKDMVVSSDLTISPLQGIDQNGDPSADGIFNFRNLTVNNNATLFNKIKYSDDYNGVGVELKVTGKLNVASGSNISGVGLGYPANTGEGKPTGSQNYYGGGGSHGGIGGRGEIGVAGSKYDSTLFPVKPGSGGYTTRGGAGGSAIKISAAEIVVDGSINQSASNGTTSAPTEGSGAAGGSIYMISNSVSGSGTIKADGSNGTGHSGGGGGGRIAIYADTTGFNPNNITAAKGTKGGVLNCADGEVGTIFLYDTASGNVTASSDVTFDANQGVNRDGSIRTDGVFYFNNLTVSNNSTVTIGGYYTNDTDGRGVTLNLDGQLTVDSGSKITATGQGYASEIGPGKGTGTASTSGSGGSYGGLGGKSYNNNLASAAYDSTKANYPYALGSGGGSGTGTGGKGGGAVALRVLGNVINNGEISADGASGIGGVSGWRPGGGSGGSVFINCDALSGSGIITAKGGAGLGDANYGSGGGGGGRISVVYSSSQSLALSNFSAAGGAGGGSVADRAGAEGSVNITQRILPVADFNLKNPNNDSTEYTNTEDVEIVPADEKVKKFKEAASSTELVPTFYAEGWNNVADGKDVGASEGTKTVRAWFKDGNELISSSIGSASITLDKTNPECVVSQQDRTELQTASTTITGTVTDDLSGVDYIEVNGNRFTSRGNLFASLSTDQNLFDQYSQALAFDGDTFNIDVDLSVGENVFSIVAVDKAGNSTNQSLTLIRTASAEEPATPEENSNGETTVTEPATSASTSSANNSSSGNAESPTTVSPSSSATAPVAEDDQAADVNNSLEQQPSDMTATSQETDSAGASEEKGWKWYWYVAIIVPIIGIIFYVYRKRAA